jgi:uncharacterized protein (DUF1684 family)
LSSSYYPRYGQNAHWAILNFHYFALVANLTVMKNLARPQLVFLLFLLIADKAIAQVDSVAAVKEIMKFQKELDGEYRDPARSPLGKNDATQFEGHDFYPINLKFKVVAKLRVTNNSPFFVMKTTGPRVNEERIFGLLEFSLQGKNFQLPVYQSSRLMKTQEYKDYLFFPFTDLTNGEETYFGGRYIDLRIPEGGEIIIDFNKAYNPYCAYASGFSCPIVPKENHLDLRITAGIKYQPKK